MLSISAAFSMIGLFLLFIISSAMEPAEVGIKEIGYDDVGRYVRVRGIVSSVYYHPDGHVFLTLRDLEGKIKVVIFSDVARDLELRESDIITINGFVDYYHGELELIVEEVE